MSKSHGKERTMSSFLGVSLMHRRSIVMRCPIHHIRRGYEGQVDLEMNAETTLMKSSKKHGSRESADIWVLKMNQLC